MIGEALKQAREERRPLLVEAITYRFRGHSMADPEEYRTKEQVAEWRKKDPIEVFARKLEEEGILGEGEAEKMDEAASRSSTSPCASPTSPKFPPPESLYDDIYVLGDQVKGWYSVDERSAGVHARREGARARQGGARPRPARLRRGGRGRPRARTLRGVEGAPSRATTPRRTKRLMAVVRYREALNQALREEMQRDENVYLMGEDIGVFNGAFKVELETARIVSATTRNFMPFMILLLLKILHLFCSILTVLILLFFNQFLGGHSVKRDHRPMSFCADHGTMPNILWN